MRKLSSIAMAGAVIVAACGKVSAIEVVGCKTDTECASTTLGDDCCTRCETVIGTQTSIAARTRSCEGKGGGPPRCPALDCRQIIDVPVCASGRCVAAPRLL